MVASRPYIVLSAAMSVDGKIATRTADSNFSSKKAKIQLHTVRSDVDAILVGKNTVLVDDPMLDARLVGGPNPIRVILDSAGSIPEDSQILRTCHDVPTIIAVSEAIPDERLARLKAHPVDVVILGKRSVSLSMLMRELHRRKIETMLVEGGGTINWSFAKAGLFDELYLTIWPFLIGGTTAPSLVQGEGFDTIKNSTKLRLDVVSRESDHLLLHYMRIG